jgi:hypothetical protein
MGIEKEWMERDREAEAMSLADEAVVKGKQTRLRESYWEVTTVGSRETLEAVNRRLRERQTIPVGAKDVREIDALKTFELGHFESYVARTRIELTQRSLNKTLTPDQRDVIKAEATYFSEKVAPAARERIEKWFDSFRTDLAGGQHTPLWKRQKLWAAVLGGSFAGVAATAALILALTRVILDNNATRAQARLNMLAREFKLDEAEHKSLLEYAKKVLKELDSNAFVTYLGWFRDTQKSFHLGLTTLRELMLDFDLKYPTHAPVGSAPAKPFTLEEIANAESYMLARYDSTTPRSYATIIQALIDIGNGVPTDPKYPDVKTLGAAQLNWFLAGALDKLREKFEDGTSEPPSAA